jgi:ketosteroid isomerase-like protein
MLLMKKRSRRLRGIGVGAIVLTLGAAASSLAGPPDTDADAVRKTLSDMARAFERNDRPALERVWADDDSVLVFENGHVNVGWADYRDNHLLPEMAAMKNTTFVLEDVRPHVAGTTAWVTLKYALSADASGRRVEGTGLATVVLEKRSGAWLIVHWHSSNPRRPPAEAHPPKD